MPQITAAKGQINICLEPLTNQGLQPLLVNAAAAASMSLTNQPVTSTQQGARLVIWVMSAPTSGSAPTITIAGTDSNGNAITEGPITIPFASPAAQSAVVGKWEYVTTKIFKTVNASGITTTNLSGTGATITIQGAQAGKYLVPGVLKAKKKLEKFSPQEHRNLLDRHTRRVQTKNVCTLDELSQVLYPENSLYMAYMLTGSLPVISSVGNFSTVLLTSTPLSGGNVTLTTPPNPGSVIQFVVTGSSTTGTFVITGTNAQGNTISETITANAGGSNGNGTYNSVNSYWTITSITYTGLTSGSAAVNGLGPQTLLAATNVSGSPLSLSTQPTAPGMPLILQVSNNPSTTGTITIAGTNQYGQSVSETIIAAASNAIYYSSNVYSAVAASGITVSGLTGGKLAISGVYGWQYVFLPGDTVYSASIEAFTGVDSFLLPWAMIEEADLEFGMDKEAKLTSKGVMQDRLVIGDRTTAYLNVNRITALGQPGDLPIVGWQSLVYIDTTAGAAPTTAFGDLLECKLNFKSPQKPNWTATNSQNYNRVNRGQRETMFSGKIDLTNVLQWEAYRLNTLQYVTFQLLGQAIGGGNNKMWQWTFPASWDDFDIDSEPSKEHVEASVQATSQYDANLGGSYRLTIINQQPPNYSL